MNRFVFLIENLAQHTPDKIGTMLGSRWELVEFRGKSYACWEDGPRYLSPEEDPTGWESIRKYVVSVCDFLGNGQVYCTSDMFWNGLDDENPWSSLPPKIGDNNLIAPDYVRYPKFLDVRPYASIVNELKADRVG